ncbi:MAG: hypothetical protein WDA75_20360, partial [Candidatus Latescibacterota bacterium]|jgi:hypothetical protein
MPIRPAVSGASLEWIPVPIDPQYTLGLTEIHAQEYRRPRPSGYSIMACLNGRFGWDWNQAGFGKVEVNDARLRQSGGTYRTKSGIPFLTPAQGPNAACVSVWENLPDELRFPLIGRAREVAVFLIGVTNPMQSRVENGRLIVSYLDGGTEELALVNPENLDDWLVAAVQTEAETEYFSDRNHGIVERIAVDPGRNLGGLVVRAVANEVILGILGITLGR